VGIKDFGVDAGYMPGYILFVEDGALVARRFDDGQLKFSSDTIRIVDGIPVTGPGRAPFSVSLNGVLAYSRSVAGITTELRWFRRDGTPAETAASAAKYTGFSSAPDGKRLVFSRWDNKGQRDIFLQDLASGALSKVTFDGDATNRYGPTTAAASVGIHLSGIPTTRPLGGLHGVHYNQIACLPVQFLIFLRHRCYNYRTCGRR